MLDSLIEISKALLTPVVAAVATYIAWQQWQTNERKARLEGYDRRLRVYEEVRKILSLVMRDTDVSTDDLLKFRVATSEADFLFGPEIPKYIDEIYRRGLSLWRWNKEYRDYTQEPPAGYDHNKLVDETHKELTWLTDQFEPAKAKFKKYLDISR